MKKFLGILILLVYILVYGEGHQLLRVPYLVKHYQKHRQADPDMGVARFLRIHYIEQVPQGDDFQQDQQLPFRSVDVSLMAPLYKSEPPVIGITPPPSDHIIHHADNMSSKPRHKTFGIFQPPRNA